MWNFYFGPARDIEREREREREEQHMVGAAPGDKKSQKTQDWRNISEIWGEGQHKTGSLYNFAFRKNLLFCPI